jgi:hypothetical protein
MRELRLYTFVNFYLSQIQQGIQTAHIVSEIMTHPSNGRVTISTDPVVQAVTYSAEDLMVMEWAELWKTIIVCNGGNKESLIELIDLFADCDNQFPWAHFHEDEESLSGALTAVGIVLPDDVYDAVYDKENDTFLYEDGMNSKFYNPETYEYDLLWLIKSKRLA